MNTIQCKNCCTSLSVITTSFSVASLQYLPSYRSGDLNMAVKFKNLYLRQSQFLKS